MRHVLLYGPPAAGKLTVARALAQRYEMTLLDNHLTFDVALRVFEFGTPEFSELVESLRTLLLEATAAAGQNTVSTFVFGHPIDLSYTARLDATAASCGLELCRVQLCPPAAVLMQRVTAPSRATTNKVRDTETLRTVLAAHDLYTPIRDGDLRINNADLAPEEVVAEIGCHFGL